MISEVHEMIPDVSRSLVHEIMKEGLVCKPQEKLYGCCTNFLTLCSEEANEFLDSIVTGDESERFITHLKANYS
jgi:hypothetical protein